MAREQLKDAPYTWHGFATRDEVAAKLADETAERLAHAIAARGAALLAVSGGATPAGFFTALSGKALSWERVTVTLVDERFVPASSPRSNAGLVAASLLRDKAAAARFVPLFREGESLERAAEDAGKTLRALPLPFDVAVLGMGNDGHTASFFPDAENLAALFDPASEKIVLPVHAPSAGEPRLTLALARIVEAGFVALLIEGQEKKAVFERAVGDGPRLPIRAVIDASPRPVEVFWAP